MIILFVRAFPEPSEPPRKWQRTAFCPRDWKCAESPEPWLSQALRGFRAERVRHGGN